MRFQIHTVCDLDEARGRMLADTHGAQFSSDIEAVLEDRLIDIVDICLPPHLHFEITMRALQRGKHVICEKPLVTSLREADALEATLQQSGCRIFPVFQYRYGIGTAQLHALMDAGLAGRCFAGTLETHWNRDAAYYAVDWRGTWAGEQGGAVLGHAIHIHDVLTSILGPVARVHAELATRVNDIEVEDCAALTLKMADGALITSSITLGAADNASRLKLVFEGFTVESDQSPYAPAALPWRFVPRSPLDRAQIEAVLSGISDVTRGYAGLFQAVADALQGAGGQEVTLADGRRSVELVSAIYQSARTGAAVDLPLSKDALFYDGWGPQNQIG